MSSDMDDDDGSDNELDDSDKLEAEDLEKDERHARMLHDITGIPTEAFQGWDFAWFPILNVFQCQR